MIQWKNFLIMHKMLRLACKLILTESHFITINVSSRRTDKHLASLSFLFAVFTWTWMRAFPSINFIILVWCQRLANGQWRAIWCGIGQGDTKVKCVWDHNPEACFRQGHRGHNNSSAIVQPLFGLAELLKSRIWPQCKGESPQICQEE